jgi:hypothetical protein
LGFLKEEIKMKIRYLFFLLVLIPALANSQEVPGPPNDLDKNYIPGKNSIFGADANKSSNDYSPSISNAVMFNPCLLLRGVAGFFYQHSLSDQVGMQLGLGFSFNKDMIMSYGSEFGEAFSDPKSAISMYSMVVYGRYSGPGLFLSGGFRFSWDSYYSLDRKPYFEVNGRFITNQFVLSGTANESDFGGAVSGTPKVSMKHTSFNLIYGVEYNTSGKIKTVHDFYFGVGLRSSSYNIFEAQQGYNYTTFVMTSRRESIIAPYLMAGYAFGLGF